eukprot:1236620-Amorphochlora_amoeboformis.AAC.1
MTYSGPPSAWTLKVGHRRCTYGLDQGERGDKMCSHLLTNILQEFSLACGEKWTTTRTSDESQVAFQAFFEFTSYFHTSSRTDITCEFLEAAVHTILCIRSVYPRAVFKAARKFGAPIRMSRHPKLNKYIADVIGGVHKCMMKVPRKHSFILGVMDRRILQHISSPFATGLVHRVEVLILNHLENHKIIEKYIFEVAPLALPFPRFVPELTNLITC